MMLLVYLITGQTRCSRLSNVKMNIDKTSCVLCNNIVSLLVSNGNLLIEGSVSSAGIDSSSGTLLSLILDN